MQIKLIPALILFLGSYFPLALILVVEDIRPEFWGRSICFSPKFWLQCELPEPAHPWLVYTFVVICSVSLAFFIWVMSYFKGSTEIAINECKAIPNDLINYVFPYIVSFMGVDLSNVGKILGFAIFMVCLFLIVYRSGQILMNPILLVIGWQLYDVQGSIEGKRRSLVALSSEKIIPGQSAQSCVVQGIYVLSKAKINGKRTSSF